MSQLEGWLTQATRHLASDSAAQVRLEIRDHYESEKEAAISRGASADEADSLAVTALGDAKVANCQYRRILLTAVEARMLREGNWEARAVCSRPRLKWLLLAIPVTALLAATALLLTGSIEAARVLFAGAIGSGLLFAAPMLPVYTPARSRIFRRVKWVALVGSTLLAFGPDAGESFWLLLSCLWPLAWIEWTRVSIRRKLRVSAWPKQLYL